MKPLLTIQIVGWNSAETLPQAALELRKLPTGFAVIRYIDNGSEDNSVEIVRRGLPQAEIVALPKNEGFAPAHNRGLALCDTSYVLTHDPDIALEVSSLARLLDLMERHQDWGSIQGKLLRAGSEAIIDSAGIVLTLTRNGKERGANEVDIHQFDEMEKIEAVTGACGLYRMQALREVAALRDGNKTEVFDSDFFAYKEDVDLGWRLDHAGWVAMYVPILMGRHHRTLGVRGLAGWGIQPAAIRDRMLSPRTRYSFRNYAWMLVKNLRGREMLVYGIFILGRLLTFAVLTLIYPKFWPVWGDIRRGIPNMIGKRL